MSLFIKEFTQLDVLPTYGRLVKRGIDSIQELLGRFDFIRFGPLGKGQRNHRESELSQSVQSFAFFLPCNSFFFGALDRG